MSWMQQLCLVYDENLDEIGKRMGSIRPLRPIFHVTMQAQIEVAIDTDGNLLNGRSRVLTNKDEQTTLVPATEASAIRTSGARAMPLFDNLSYVAGDFSERTESNGKFQIYMEELEAWLDFSGNHPTLKAIYSYLQKKSLIDDLVREHILFENSEGLLMDKWKEEAEKPPIFKAVASGEQQKAFVRFRLYSADGSELRNDEPWRDRTLWNSWIAFERANAAEKQLCYATGQYATPSSAAPKFIRRPGDGAKLISGNDSDNFTYRGLFLDSAQASSVSREAVEKAHAALSWLISRQGYQNGDQVIVSWRKAGEPSLGLLEDSESLLSIMQVDLGADAGDNFAVSLSAALLGYEKNLDAGDKAVIMGLDSATPGRLSVFYYQETSEKQLVENIRHWHRTCCFPGMSKFKKTGVNEKGKEQFTKLYFTGAPSIGQIFNTAYGMNADDKYRKAIFERLLPCISSRARLPRDIMLAAAHSASRPLAADEKEDKNRTLAIACALVRKYHNDITANKNDEGEWKMYLDENVNDRSYLFGRMLAYAQYIEQFAQYKKASENGDDKRPTNAQRLRAAFAQHPARTWMVLDRQLIPYITRLV